MKLKGTQEDIIRTQSSPRIVPVIKEWKAPPFPCKVFKVQTRGKQASVTYKYDVNFGDKCYLDTRRTVIYNHDGTCNGPRQLRRPTLIEILSNNRQILVHITFCVLTNIGLVCSHCVNKTYDILFKIHKIFSPAIASFGFELLFNYYL